MLIDSRTLPANETIETEVCIVGAGPAGITLARELAGQSFRVCLLESGGLEVDAQTQSLCEAETVVDTFPVQAPHDTRRRQFGGTSNAWAVKIGNQQIGVRHMPLSATDFEQRAWLPYSGWPFTRSHLEPFYERAQAVCQLGPFAYDAEAWKTAEAPSLPLIGSRLNTSMFQFGPRDIFSQEYRDEISRARNITTYLNANVVEIETDPTASMVTRVRVACLGGHSFWVAAKLFILATGGIENARLLLLSNQIQKTGLGNQNDLVGRFFMEHPMVGCGLFIPANSQIFNHTALYDMRRVQGTPVMGILTLTEDTMRREQLMNISAMLFPVPKPYQVEAAESLKTLMSKLLRAKLPEHALQQVKNVASGLDYLVPAAGRAAFQNQSLLPNMGRGGWSDLRHNERRFTAFEVIHQTEQAPDPDNRVTLSAEQDRLGRRKARLHWRWLDADIHSIQRAQQIMAEEIERSGLGRLVIEHDGGFPKLYTPAGTHHHMGTTRMHPDPKQGVVNENCRVHGISNLFIAGSSVFPTGGFANPTLTIVALAVRLADQVKAILAPHPVEVSQSMSPSRLYNSSRQCSEADRLRAAKVAYLVQTYKNPAQIYRLVSTLRKSSPEAFILVSHNFAACDLEIAPLRELGVEVLSVKGGRGDFSLVQAYLDAIDWLIARKIDFDWLINISGQDYPTQPLSHIEQFLTETEYDGFFDYFNVFSDQCTWGIRDGRDRYLYQYWWSGIELSRWQRGLLKPLRLLINYSQPLVRVDFSYGLIVGLRAISMPFNQNFRCYGGSYFKTISRECAQYLDQFSKQNHHLVDYYKKVRLSDESFVQTVLLNSGRFKFYGDNKRYIDFSGSQHGHPRTLTRDDYPNLISDDIHFARKFDLEQDGEILDLLDARVLQAAERVS